MVTDLSASKHQKEHYTAFAVWNRVCQGQLIIKIVICIFLSLFSGLIELGLRQGRCLGQLSVWLQIFQLQTTRKNRTGLFFCPQLSLSRSTDHQNSYMHFLYHRFQVSELGLTQGRCFLCGYGFFSFKPPERIQQSFCFVWNLVCQGLAIIKIVTYIYYFIVSSPHTVRPSL